MTNSRDKGARGERELAAWLTERGYPAHRGRRYHGGADCADVGWPRLPGHCGAKRTETARQYDPMAQAVDDAGNKVPVVAHRKSRGEWLAVLELKDLLAIIRDSDHCPSISTDKIP